MGCGISTLDVEDASLNQHSKGRRHAIVPSIVDKKKNFENGDEGDGALLHTNNDNNNNNNKDKDVVLVTKPLGSDEGKDGGSNGKMLKEKSFVERNNINKEEEKVFGNGQKEKHSGGYNKYCEKNNIEEEHEDQDNRLFVGPRSPSFREYCNDYDCGDQIFIGDSNDYDSMESIKNGSEDSSINKNKPKNEESANSKKESDKKERMGRGFRNVINKGKVRGRRNFLNFACYNASNESHAEASFNKIVAKSA
ncbi:hypothetical protein JHK82_053150 [Glycine max]|nr:hypothetical protein JHK86_052999 [Glycine max]KAG4927373.1 hypothetical protein JHK85_053859 [Glycine max]KAG5082988.1 hypothetical protein JHK84_053026 [Glycine max]KAG5085753.1 hypothetical protein JHK82_053150 [Glycine max]